MLRACAAIRKRIVFDKTSSKHFDTFVKACRDVYRPPLSSSCTAAPDSCPRSILSLAAGLSDMIDADDVCLSDEMEGSDDEDFEDTVSGGKDKDCREVHETTLAPAARGRIARASKAQASSRIAQQLSDENEINCRKEPKAVDEGCNSESVGVL